MAYVKTSVDTLNQQKREYEKAVKSLDNALEQIKKVNRSLGKDAMLEGVRNALTKLSASLETRAGVLLLMTKALEQSGEKYTTSQKKAVAKSNQFRAHNRDFYGNPVVVTAATATVAATATASASGVDSSVPITSQNTENVPVQTDSEIRPAAEPVSTGSMGSGPVEGGTVTGAVDTGSSDPGANVFAVGAAAAAGAVIGGIAGRAMGALVKPGQKKTEPTPEEKEQESSTDIEAQLEAAKERLRRLNEMEEKV